MNSYGKFEQLFYVCVCVFKFLATWSDIQVISSLTRDRNCALCSGGEES